MGRTHSPDNGNTKTGYNLQWRPGKHTINKSFSSDPSVKFRYVTEAPAGVTVTPATGGPLDNNAVLINSITNTNDQAQLVKFIVTPYTRQAGSENEKCTGINDTAYVWVEPTARITVTPKLDTICNGSQVNITLTSPSVPTRSVKFRYVTEAPAGVTVTPATGGPLDNNAVLINSITNINDQAQLVKFIVTPYTRQAGSENEKCTGINDTAYVWVEPTARITVTPKQDTICNGDQVSIHSNQSFSSYPGSEVQVCDRGPCWCNSYPGNRRTPG